MTFNSFLVTFNAAPVPQRPGTPRPTVEDIPMADLSLSTSEYLVPKPKNAKKMAFAVDFDDGESNGQEDALSDRLMSPQTSTVLLQRRVSASSQNSFQTTESYEIIDGVPKSSTPASSVGGLGYDFLDDLSVTSDYVSHHSDMLINKLRQVHQEPIQLINFENLLKYFEENPRIEYFSEAHHVALGVRIAADADNLIEVWQRMSLYVDKNPNCDRNILRMHALLRSYLIKTGHDLSNYFKNEVYDDEASLESYVGTRGDDSTIATEETSSQASLSPGPMSPHSPENSSPGAEVKEEVPSSLKQLMSLQQGLIQEDSMHAARFFMTPARLGLGGIHTLNTRFMPHINRYVRAQSAIPTVPTVNEDSEQDESMDCAITELD